MGDLTKYQRMLRTLRCEKTDRLPWSAYVHSSVHDRGARQFANFTLNFYKKYEPDYIKVMYDENYDTPVNFQYCQDISVWGRLEVLDPHKGAFGRQLTSLKIIKDTVGADVPVLLTLYSPMHFGVRMAWKRVVEDCRADCGLVGGALGAVAESEAAFVKACINEAGIDGFFFGAYGCEPSWMTADEYKKFAMPHDKKVLAAMREAPMVILHIHGTEASYFDELEHYDCDALSWEDRSAGPSIAEARKKTKKCLVGGVDNVKALTASPEEVLEEARDAVRQSGGYGLVLSPGCTFDEHTPAENILALKKAVGA